MALSCPGAYGAEQNQGYRVELLVLRHLDGQAELPPQTTLKDFSAALDLLLPPAEPAAEEAAAADEAPAQGFETGPLPAEQAAQAADPAVQIALVDTQSDKMQLAWQRLRTSSAYRPELYLSWQQPGEQPYPLIRLHDQEVLIEDDPYAELRMNAQASGNDAVAVFSDIGAPAIASGADGAGEATDSALPEPTRFYRLDGSARLRRSRFLHLDLDIEYREPLSSELAPAQPAAFLVHALQQSRQVQIEHMEYFDGPVIAVLALVSRIDNE